jgi:hypothetical protein
MSQIVDALGQVFSAIEHLILDHEEDSQSPKEGFNLEVNHTKWHKLLRPFSNIKNLCTNHGLVEGFSHYLRLDNGELPPELTYSRSSNTDDAFTSFIDARI